MSPPLLFRVTAVAVVAAGIAMTMAGGATSVWAWTTPDTHPAFRAVLPLATAWLVFTMVKLALALPRLEGGGDAARARSADRAGKCPHRFGRRVGEEVCAGGRVGA